MSSPTLAPPHTKGHLHCPACDQLDQEAMSAERLPELNIASASARWLEDKRLYIRPRTVLDYQQYFHALAEFFGDLPLKDFKIGNLRAYQKWRQTNGPIRTDKAAPKQKKPGAGALRINNEVRALGQLLTEARIWHRIKPYYKPLPVSYEGPGQALSHEQAKHLFQVAGTNKRWQVSLWMALLMTQTTLGPGELRNLQLGDLNLEQAELTVRRAVKNKYRVRIIQLNKRALYALRKLVKRAEDKGCKGSTDYLLPHHGVGGEHEYDCSRPQASWRSAWHSLRTAAGFPNLRPYDLRHTAVTWMLEDASVPTQAVVETAGWVDPKMIRRYSHQKKEAKRKAVQALDQLDLFDPPIRKSTNAIDEMMEQEPIDPKKLQ